MGTVRSVTVARESRLGMRAYEQLRHVAGEPLLLRGGATELLALSPLAGEGKGRCFVSREEGTFPTEQRAC